MCVDHFRRSVLAVATFLVAMGAGYSYGGVLRIVDDPRSEPGAEFGRALAAVGADLAVGAPGARVFDDDRAGRVQLFDASGALLTTFEAQTPVAGAELGTTVVESDGLLFVGAPGDQPIGLGGTGAVYVFDAATGKLVRIVRAPDPDASTAPTGGTGTGSGLPQSTAPQPVAQGFGRALAVTAGVIMVGAPESSIDGVADAGAVYLFRLDGTAIDTLEEFPARAGALFGASVAVVGDAIFVGVPGAPAGTVGGAGVVREFDAATRSPRTSFGAPISATGAEFGAVVGAVGEDLFVAAPGDSALGPDGSGTVYLFDPSTTAFRASLRAPTAAPSLDFGRAVVPLGGNLLVGADGAGDDRSGEAYLVDPTTSALVTRFSPTIERSGGGFGFALAIVGPLVAIGEPAVGSPSTTGRVWLFDPQSATVGGDPMRTPAVASPAGPSCPGGSIRCRVIYLLASVDQRDLTRPLRRTLRALRAASNARGRSRVRALDRAANGIREFAVGLGSAGDLPGMPADRRDALLAVSDAVSADLATLIANAD